MRASMRCGPITRYCTYRAELSHGTTRASPRRATCDEPRRRGFDRLKLDLHFRHEGRPPRPFNAADITRYHTYLETFPKIAVRRKARRIEIPPSPASNNSRPKRYVHSMAHVEGGPRCRTSTLRRWSPGRQAQSPRSPPRPTHSSLGSVVRARDRPTGRSSETPPMITRRSATTRGQTSWRAIARAVALGLISSRGEFATLPSELL